jgi:hypothetical protein
MRRGVIGRELRITAVAIVKLLELLGYRFDKRLTDALYTLDAGSVGGMATLFPMIGASTACLRYQVGSPRPKQTGNR